MKIKISLLCLLLIGTVFAQVNPTSNLGLNRPPFKYPHYDVPINANADILDNIFALATCGDSTHVLGWNLVLKKLNCQTVAGGIPIFFVSTLPVSPATGTVAVISDGNSGTDCLVGGGSSLVFCRFGGSSWGTFSAGSAGAGGSPNQLQYSNAGALGGISGWSTNGATTITAGTTSILDLHAANSAADFLLPGALSTGLVTVTTATGAVNSVAAPAGTVVGTTDTQALTNKNLTGAGNTFPTLNQNTSGTAANLSGTPALPNGTMATTQSLGDNTTKLATTAFVLANGGSSAFSAITPGTNAAALLVGTGGSLGTSGSGAIIATSLLGQTWTSPTITTPTIGSFVNATHNHQNAAGGGLLDAAAISTGLFATARIPWATPGTIGSTTPSTGAFTGLTATGLTSITPSATSASGALNVAPTATGTPAAIFNCATGLTANCFKLQIGGVDQFIIDLNGKMIPQASSALSASFNMAFGTAPTSPVSGDWYGVSPNLIQYFDANSVTQTIATNNLVNTFNLQQIFAAPNATSTPVVIKASSGQSQDLLQIQDSTAAVLAHFAFDGGLIAPYYKTSGSSGVAGLQGYGAGTDPGIQTNEVSDIGPAVLTGTGYNVALPGVEPTAGQVRTVGTCTSHSCTSSWATPSGSGTVTHTAGALTANSVVLGNGSADTTVAAADSTTTHAFFATAGAPAFRAIASGDIPTLNQDTTGSAAKVNGIAYSATAAAHSVEVITTANTTATAKVIPDCTDSAGNHLNYTQSSDAFSCGTTASGGGSTSFASLTAGTVTSVGVFPGGDLFYSGINAQSGTSYTLVVGDENKLITFNNASAVAVTLPQATTTGFTAGAVFHVRNYGVGIVTITPTTSTIDTLASITVRTDGSANIYSDGTNYSTQRFFHNPMTTAGDIIYGGTSGLATRLAGAAGILRSNATSPSYAELSGDATTSGSNAVSLAAPFKKRSCEIVIGGTGTSNVLQSGDDSIANNSCFNKIGVTETITALYCMGDVASDTVTVNPTFGASGTGTTILSGALTCGSSNAYSSTGTVSNGALTDGSGISPAMAGTLNAHSIHILVVYTVPSS